MLIICDDTKEIGFRYLNGSIYKSGPFEFVIDNKKIKFDEVRHTHWNGDNPFIVMISKRRVDIFYHTKPKVQTIKHICTISPKKIFAGNDPNYGFDGNTVLIQLESDSNKYIHVGYNVYSFTSDNPIIHYSSPLGNSDVPYPYAVSKDYVYLLLDKVKIPVSLFPKDHIDKMLILGSKPGQSSWDTKKKYTYDPYGDYYHSKLLQKHATKYRVQTIFKHSI